MTDLTNYRTLLTAAEAALRKFTWRLPFIFEDGGEACTLSSDQARDIYSSRKALKTTHIYECIQQFTSRQAALQAMISHVHTRYARNDPMLVLDWMTLRTILAREIQALLKAHRKPDLEATIDEAGNVLYHASCAIMSITKTAVPKAEWLDAFLARVNEASGDKRELRAMFRAALTGPRTRYVAPKTNHDQASSFGGAQQIHKESAEYGNETGQQEPARSLEFLQASILPAMLECQKTQCKAVGILQAMFRQMEAKRQVLCQMELWNRE